MGDGGWQCHSSLFPFPSSLLLTFRQDEDGFRVKSCSSCLKGSSMPLHAELHRHLGGAVVPRILWRFLQRRGHPLAEVYPEYNAFEAFFTRPRANLSEFLELHTQVESVQRLETLPYFVSKLLRGACVFEGILYMELRYTPYYRTNPELSEADRLAQMREVVRVVQEASIQPEYPVRLRQILCMHSRLPAHINRAILELAAQELDAVCA